MFVYLLFFFFFLFLLITTVNRRRRYYNNIYINENARRSIRGFHHRFYLRPEYLFQIM